MASDVRVAAKARVHLNKGLGSLASSDEGLSDQIKLILLETTLQASLVIGSCQVGRQIVSERRKSTVNDTSVCIEVGGAKADDGIRRPNGRLIQGRRCLIGLFIPVSARCKLQRCRIRLWKTYTYG
jgi:hypothetical protein